jgi:hypothetical protein
MYVYCLFIFSFVSLLRKYVVLLTKIMYYNKDSTQCRIVRSLKDRIAFIINIYQYNKLIQSVISTPKNAKYIRVVEILLALMWEDGRGL